MAFSLNKIELWLFEFWWYVWWDKRLSWEFHIFSSLYVLLCISIVGVLLALRFSLRFSLVDRRTSGYDFGSNCLSEFDLVLVVYFPLGTKAFPLCQIWCLQEQGFENKGFLFFNWYTSGQEGFSLIHGYYGQVGNRYWHMVKLKCLVSSCQTQVQSQLMEITRAQGIKNVRYEGKQQMKGLFFPKRFWIYGHMSDDVGLQENNFIFSASYYTFGFLKRCMVIGVIKDLIISTIAARWSNLNIFICEY